MKAAAIYRRKVGARRVARALDLPVRTVARHADELPLEYDRRGHPWTTAIDASMRSVRDPRALTMLRPGVANLAAFNLGLANDAETLSLAVALERAAETAALDAIALATAERAAGRGCEAFQGLTRARYHTVRCAPRAPFVDRQFDSIDDLAAFLGESVDTVRRVARADATFPMGRACDDGLPTLGAILVWETRQHAPAEDGDLVRLTARGALAGAALGIRPALWLLAAEAARAELVAAMNARGADVRRAD